MLPRQARLSMVERFSTNGMMETSEGIGILVGFYLRGVIDYWRFRC